MATKQRSLRPAVLDPGYPSLREHVAAREPRPSRRLFLGMAGASLAAGGLAACSRNLGIGGEPDEDIQIGGVPELPEYYSVRFPAEGDLSTWLVGSGYATYWVLALTWNEASYHALLDFRSEAEALLRNVLADHTYDSLSTDDGVDAAEDDLLEALDVFCQEMGGHADPTIEKVTLTLTYLAPGDDIMGIMGDPDYS